MEGVAAALAPEELAKMEGGVCIPPEEGLCCFYSIRQERNLGGDSVTRNVTGRRIREIEIVCHRRRDGK